MRKNINVTIGGMSFTILTNRTVTEHVLTRKSLLDCYGKPSEYKRAIYEMWMEWAYENNAMLTISGYNCMMFTLHGYITYNGALYYIYITKTRQELIPVIGTTI